MKATDYAIKEGGLLRCCIETLIKTELDSVPEEGDTIQCLHCKDFVTMHKGFWQWDPGDDLSLVPVSP